MCDCCTKKLTENASGDAFAKKDMRANIFPIMNSVTAASIMKTICFTDVNCYFFTEEKSATD
jgi:hypothetical protein